jgi:serine/threonine protein kinase
MISNRDCELDYGTLINFDESIQDLMFKISSKKPHKRNSAKEALRHRVFRELGLVDVGKDPNDMEDNLYKKYNDLKRK